jgi:Clp amino terminal domain, pathogenicity island component
VVGDEQPGGPYLEAIRRAFLFAREHGRRCGPAEFLVGISEGRGPAATALDPGSERTLREVASSAAGPVVGGPVVGGPVVGGPVVGGPVVGGPVAGGPVAGSLAGRGAGYLHMQAQEAATSLAAARNQPAAPEHLLIALLDQGTPEVADLLSRAGLEPAAVRRATLTAIGAPADLPLTPLPPLTPAGTLDRPPLPVADLNPRAWTVLRWRQDHLPLDRLRRTGDLLALSHLERAAAWRLAERLGLDDDQRYSLVWQHDDEVRRLAVRIRPDLADPRLARFAAVTGRPRRRRRPVSLNVTVGWSAWFGNRRVGLRDRWFRLRTIQHYRGCPQP